MIIALLDSAFKHQSFHILVLRITRIPRDHMSFDELMAKWAYQPEKTEITAINNFNYYLNLVKEVIEFLFTDACL